MLPENRPDMIAMLDQMSTGLENISKLMASYYKNLIDGGVPEPLAQALVIDFQRVIFTPFMQSGK